MQDKHKFKQLGLIYESMVTRGEGGPPDPSSPNFTDRTMSVKVKLRGKGLLTLRFDKNALRPFLDKQNDSINDFLVALGVPDNGQNGPYPFELLQPSDIEYLVRMLNKEFGTTFSYDDVDMILIDAGPNEEHDDDEDAEDSAAASPSGADELLNYLTRGGVYARAGGTREHRGRTADIIKIPTVGQLLVTGAFVFAQHLGAASSGERFDLSDPRKILDWCKRGLPEDAEDAEDGY